jgi:hypothetical protein
MGLFSGKRHSETKDEFTARVETRRRDRARKEAQPRPRKPEKSPFDYKMAYFHELAEHQAYGEAMKVWYGLVDEAPDDLGKWLDANPGFTPRYGIHYGPPGSEPWRPVVVCKACGSRHRYGAKCWISPGLEAGVCSRLGAST